MVLILCKIMPRSAESDFSSNGTRHIRLPAKRIVMMRPVIRFDISYLKTLFAAML
jgi:hypothetical protein